MRVLGLCITSMLRAPSPAPEYVRESRSRSPGLVAIPGGRSAEALHVGDAGKRAVFGIRIDDDSIVRSRSASSVSIDGRRYSGSTRPTSSSSRAHAARDLHVVCAARPDLACTRGGRSPPSSACGRSPAARPHRRGMTSPRSWRLPRNAQQAMNLVDGEHRRRRIVDRGRERLEARCPPGCGRRTSDPARACARVPWPPSRAGPRRRSPPRRRTSANSGSSAATKSPTCGTNSITPPWRRASATMRRRGRPPSTIPAFALCSTVRDGAPSCARSGRRFGDAPPPYARGIPSGLISTPLVADAAPRRSPGAGGAPRSR